MRYEFSGVARDQQLRGLALVRAEHAVAVGVALDDADLDEALDVFDLVVLDAPDQVRAVLDDPPLGPVVGVDAVGDVAAVDERSHEARLAVATIAVATHGRRQANVQPR